MNRKIKIFRKKTNLNTVKIPKCNGKRYVISDIHGCLHTFKSLINKIGLTKDDQLFLLGDYIDRGQDSKGVIDYIIELQKEFQVFPIRGNHEENILLLLKFENNSLIQKHIQKENRHTLFNTDLKIDYKYIQFIRELPFYIELENVILVHAGFDFNAEKPFNETDEMLWIREFENNFKFTNGKKIIHGHTPYTLEDIQTKIKNDESILPLDNGCVFNEIDGYGNLLCMDIDTLELKLQKNIENL